MALVLTSAILLLSDTPAARAGATPFAMSLSVDATEAPRGIVHVREHFPVTAGPLILEYPRWLPGEHAPNGPISNLAALTISAGGERLSWKRDDVDLYAFSVDVPAAATALDISFDYLGNNLGKYSAARLSTPNMLALTWNKVALTPRIADYRTFTVTPSIALPAQWQFACALEPASTSGTTTTFAPVTFEMLIDSPLDAGSNVKKFALGRFDGAPVELDAFADTPEELAISAATIAKYRNLVAEMHALYGARHFLHYNFLLTLSDVLPGEGLEHHQSSDNGGFFVRRVDTIAPHPPDFMTPGGYTLVHSAKPSALEKLLDDRNKTLDIRYLLGIVAKSDGTVTDVIEGMPAARAGIRPGAKVAGVNGSTFDGDRGQVQLDAALTAAEHGAGLRLLITGDRIYREYTFDERGGPKYPHLARLPHTRDVLSQIAAPKRPNPVPPSTPKDAN